MVNIKFSNNLIFLLLFYIILIPKLVIAFDITSNISVTVSATVASPTPPGGGGGGGGGGGSGDVIVPTTVNFSGMAYPSSRVTILNNGNVAITTMADPAARFSVSLSNLSTGTHNFSVFGEDANRVKSLTFSFPVYVTAGTTVNIGGIFLSPTISIDKSEVKKGDTLTVFGQTIPNTEVNVVFHSDQEIIKKLKTDLTGLYKYVMDTTPLEYGDHKVKSKTLVDEEVSAISAELPFIVGSVSKLIDDTGKCGKLRGDLNCDNHVNLTDFSVMAFWYNKPGVPAKVDLNNDKKVSLVDFSIMAFNWTG